MSSKVGSRSINVPADQGGTTVPIAVGVGCRVNIIGLVWNNSAIAVGIAVVEVSLNRYILQRFTGALLIVIDLCIAHPSFFR